MSGSRSQISNVKNRVLVWIHDVSGSRSEDTSVVTLIVLIPKLKQVDLSRDISEPYYALGFFTLGNLILGMYRIDHSLNSLLWHDIVGTDIENFQTELFN